RSSEASGFIDEAGKPIRSEHLADRFREHLRAAGVVRAELYQRSAERRPIRLHNTRATFITKSTCTGAPRGRRPSLALGTWPPSTRRSPSSPRSPLAQTQTAVEKAAAAMAIPIRRG